MSTEKTLGTFEKYLWLWVVVCMLIGLLLSQYFPAFGQWLDEWKVGNVSVPIGICLFFMMYPALLNFQLKEVKKLMSAPKPILLTLFSNWVFAPLVTAGLAYYFLEGHDQLIVALILLGASPCTAMVIVWGSLAKGNQEQNVITTSINTATIMILYAPVVVFLTGIQGIMIDRFDLFISVLVFIGLPLVAGLVSKKVIVQAKNIDYFENKFRPMMGKVAIFSLLLTLIVLFSLNGNVLIQHPEEMVLVSIPMLIGFVLVVLFNVLITRLFKLHYKEAVISVLIGSSSHFEIAIATAISLYGVGSLAALGTTMGLFWEVPIMLGLVYLGKYLQTKNFWLPSKN